jgi:hypothetical protein
LVKFLIIIKYLIKLITIIDYNFYLIKIPKNFIELKI